MIDYEQFSEAQDADAPTTRGERQTEKYSRGRYFLLHLAPFLYHDL
jgi:hypothetical protein